MHTYNFLAVWFCLHPDEGSFLPGCACDACGQTPDLQSAEQRGGHQPRAGERVYQRGLGARHPGGSTATLQRSSAETSVRVLVRLMVLALSSSSCCCLGMSRTVRNKGLFTLVQRPRRNDAPVSTGAGRCDQNVLSASISIYVPIL